MTTPHAAITTTNIQVLNADGPPPGWSLWLGLLHPDDTEVTAPSYGRIPVTARFRLVLDEFDSLYFTNEQGLTWPESQEDWGLVGSIGYFRAERGGTAFRKATLGAVHAVPGHTRWSITPGYFKLELRLHARYARPRWGDKR